jgi:hypothetical protein
MRYFVQIDMIMAFWRGGQKPHQSFFERKMLHHEAKKIEQDIC